MPEQLNPLLKRVPAEELDEKHRVMWEMVNETVGTGAMIEVLANHPAATDFYTDDVYPRLFYNSQSDMLVNARLKELFRFKMGQRHGCFSCNSFNWQTTLDAGFTEEQLENVIDPTPGLFTDEELAVLDLAELFVLWNVDASLTADLYERLSKHLSDAQVLELGVIGAFFMGWQRLMFVFDITAREATCPIPSPVRAAATP